MGDVMVSSYDLSHIVRTLDAVARETDSISGRVYDVESKVNTSLAMLEQLRHDLIEMAEDQKRDNEHQRALTRLTNVRQMLEQEYGSYNEVRRAMLGVLQATDAQLVRQETISKVTEELMLKNSEYWLAPCLIAVSAWIGNDKALADRAIRIAMERDKEKTALCMALICRRNQREDTCFEWLSIYFANQSADDFSDSTFSFVDAYVNGVFGIDRNNRCTDYINKWIHEIQDQSDDFETRQTQHWADHFASYAVSTAGKYPALKESVAEFPLIDGYVSRLLAADPIEESFLKLMGAEIDKKSLIQDIDNRLVALVSRYAAEELPLREEEEYLLAIDEFRGDLDKANAKVNAAREARKEKKMDLVKKMAEIISGDDSNSKSISERRTAISFLHDYINSGYEHFLVEKKDQFPRAVKIQVDGWTGTTTDSSNANLLYADYQQYINNQRAQRLATVPTNPGLSMFIGGGIVAVLAIILACFTHFFVGIIGVVAAVGMILSGVQRNKQVPAMKNAINKEYDEKIQAGLQKIYNAADQWRSVQTYVAEFGQKQRNKLVS